MQASGDAPDNGTVAVTLAFLRSYEHMGQFVVECAQGCACLPLRLDGNHEHKNSLLSMESLLATRAGEWAGRFARPAAIPGVDTELLACPCSEALVGQVPLLPSGSLFWSVVAHHLNAQTRAWAGIFQPGALHG